MSDRDTHFLGFAKLLLLDLFWRSNGFSLNVPTAEEVDTMQKIVAQRAYDFACHVATQNTLVAHGDMSKIPDLTTWETNE